MNFIEGHLLFASVASTYIVLAIKLLEEPGLRRKIGPQYEKYMKTTPAFCPFLTMGKPKSVEKKDWYPWKTDCKRFDKFRPTFHIAK